jgi:hypothetical protein
LRDANRVRSSNEVSERPVVAVGLEDAAMRGVAAVGQSRTPVA